MKMFTIRKAALVTCCIALIGSSAKAATFTAIASGNFSATSTWSGGVVPGTTILADQIVIPSGITVTLDQNQTINGTLAALNVDGTLTSTGSNSLILTAGALSGTGTLNIDSLALGLTSGFGFTGTINAQKFTSIGATLATNATINVMSKLELRNAPLNLNSGSLTLSNGATIIVSGGTMMASGGTYNMINGYNVIYMNNSANTGLEISGSGLTDVEVNVPMASTITLSSDLTVKGMLKLTAGNLNTNNKKLYFVGNGSFSSAGSGMIVATSGTDITVTSGANFDGGIRFSNTGNTINNLTINMNNNTAYASLGSNLTVNGTLNLQAGRLNLWSNTLTVGASGSMVGGSTNSFVITGKNGSLVASLGAGSTNTYHVGSTAGYAPVMITGNTGSATGNVGVGVNDTVWSEGTTGANLSANQPLVNATWYITHSATSGINLKLQAMWSAAMEVNGFNRNKLYLSHYTAGNWDVQATTAATASGSMYTATRDNITTLSPFAVIGEGANTTSVKNIAVANAVNVYPNPATNTIQVTGNYTQAKIYNLSGTLVKTTGINSNAISVAELPQGVYTVLFNSAETTATARFVKQ